ncbi:MAG: hypothetical protein E7358_07290 [Clostridiales bacterium]|nr:hypothetical protein [Clostridiales bacterium]
MKDYLIISLSIVVLLAFLDIFISKTKNGKVVKSVISVISVTMLLTPIVSIIKGDSSLLEGGYYNEYLSEYLIELEKKVVVNKIDSALDNLDYLISDFELEFSNENDCVILEKIKLKVINQNYEHIDILETVKNSLKTVVDVEKVEINFETD